MDEQVRYTIDDDDGQPAQRRSDAHANAELEKTRHALADAAAARNELLQARREQAAVHLERINTEAECAQQGYQHAWESGDAAKMADAQREIAALEVKRNNVCCGPRATNPSMDTRSPRVCPRRAPVRENECCTQ